MAATNTRNSLKFETELQAAENYRCDIAPGRAHAGLPANADRMSVTLLKVWARWMEEAPKQRPTDGQLRTSVG